MAAAGDIVAGLRLERALGEGAWRVRAVDSGRVFRLQPGPVPAALRGRVLPGVLPVLREVALPEGPATLLEFVGGTGLDRRLAAGPLDEALAARVRLRLEQALVALAELGLGLPDLAAHHVILAPPELDGRGEPVGLPEPWLLPLGLEVGVAATEQDRRRQISALLGALSPPSARARLPGAAPAPVLAPAPPAAVPSTPAVPPAAPSRGAISRTGTVRALVVDEAGRGHVVVLELLLETGHGRIWAPEGIARDAQVAAQLAVAAALGSEARDWDLRWTVADRRIALHGSSIGLGIAVGVGLLRRGQEIPADWAFTGGVELDGRISSVAGVPAKVRAAAAAGLGRVGLSAADLPGLSAPDGLRLVGRPTLEALWPALQPRRAALWRWWRLGWLVLPVLLALTGLLSPVEAWVGHGLTRASRGSLPADDVAILAVDVPDPRALRARHAQTLRALAAAGVRAVVFDLALSTPSVHDADIAEAIGELGAQGVPVVLPVRFRLDGVSEPPAALLAAGAHAGIVEAHKDLLLDVVQATPMRRFGPDGRVYWHVAALAAAAAQRPEAPPVPRIDGNQLVIGALRSPVWAGLLHWPPADPPPAVPYGRVSDYGALADKIVFIGAWGGSDDVHLTPSGRAYGVEILAGAVQTLLRQAGLRRAAPELSALAALLAGLATAWLAAALPVARRRRALIVPVGILGLGAALSLAGLLVAMLPAALAAAVGLWAERGARRG